MPPTQTLHARVRVRACVIVMGSSWRGAGGDGGRSRGWGSCRGTRLADQVVYGTAALLHHSILIQL